MKIYKTVSISATNGWRTISADPRRQTDTLGSGSRRFIVSDNPEIPSYKSL